MTNSIFNVRLDGLNRMDRSRTKKWLNDVGEKEEKEGEGGKEGKICTTIRMSKGEGIRDEQTLVLFV